MSDDKRHILVVDDSEEDRETYRRLLCRVADCQYVLTETESGDDGLAECRSNTPDCVLLDYRLPDMDGLEFLEELADGADAIAIPVVMLTGQGSEAVAVKAMKHGAQDYLVKDRLTAEALGRAVENAIEKKSLQRKVRESNELLKSKNARLAEMYETAHQFVDHVSHEFRTPLTVIKEYSSIIRDGLVGEVNDDQREYLNIVVNRVDDLSILVTDMLDISKLEAGMLRVARRDCRVEDIIERVRATLERKAAASKVTLDVEVESGLPEVYCDAEKVGRIFINLVVNAVKFSGENGHVTVRVRDDSGASQVAVDVTDNGPGIAPDNLEKIFERFKQVGGDARVSAKGFGLGLNIAKELAHLNLGEITVASELGKGSTFSFTIPTTDRMLLLRRYLDRFEAVGDPTSSVSLVAVVADQAADGSGLDELQQVLEHNLRRTDLVLRVQPATWLVLAVRTSQEPAGVPKRIEQGLRDASGGRHGVALPAAELGVRCTWRRGESRVELTRNFEAECPAVVIGS